VHPAPPPETITPVAGSDGMLERGAAIGRFVVLGLLGKGGMGEVYAAHDPELDRKVAIKLLRGGSESESPEGRLRLMREAQAIARVSHPNVVVVYDVGTLGKRVFIAMELIDGSTLRYWMHARQRSWPEILEVFNISKVGKVAGCRVTEGVVQRGAHVRLIRDNVVIHEGKLATLKRFKDEVREVQTGQECGMGFVGYHDLAKGDTIECYEVETIKRAL